MKSENFGIDGITFEILLSDIDKRKNIKSQPLISYYNNLNLEYGKIIVKDNKAIIFVVLPNFYKTNNITPYCLTSITDRIKLDIIKMELLNILNNIFSDVSQIRLKSIECNTTHKVLDGCSCNNVLNLINRSYYDTINTSYESASQSCKYRKEKQSLIIRIKNYYFLKCYNKSLEQKKSVKSVNMDIDDNLLRIEIVMLVLYPVIN